MTELVYAVEDFIRSDAIAWCLLGIAGAGVITSVVIAVVTPRGEQGGWKKVTDD